MRRVAILTGGGDCPGLNAVIRATVHKGHQLGLETVGVKNGWAGMAEGEFVPLVRASVVGILGRGGTILGTTRANPYRDEATLDQLKRNWERLGLDSAVVIGGEDTLSVALKLSREGYPTVGVPKTIDNDIGGTDYTFGFDTAVNIVTEAIDRLRTTAESHERVIVLEVMGRHVGWIAGYAGLAGSADCILVPERPFKVEEVAELIKKRLARGRPFSIIVIAEGAKPKELDSLVTQSEEKDEFGHVRLGGVGEVLARMLAKLTGSETRAVALGHIQRGGSPSPFDRVLATRFGVKAMELVAAEEFGQMVALNGTEIVSVPLEEALRGPKYLPDSFFRTAELFFG